MHKHDKKKQLNKEKKRKKTKRPKYSEMPLISKSLKDLP